MALLCTFSQELKEKGFSSNIQAENEGGLCNACHSPCTFHVPVLPRLVSFLAPILICKVTSPWE